MGGIVDKNGCGTPAFARLARAELLHLDPLDAGHVVCGIDLDVERPAIVADLDGPELGDADADRRPRALQPRAQAGQRGVVGLARLRLADRLLADARDDV